MFLPMSSTALLMSKEDIPDFTLFSLGSLLLLLAASLAWSFLREGNHALAAGQFSRSAGQEVSSWESSSTVTFTPMLHFICYTTLYYCCCYSQLLFFDAQHSLTWWVSSSKRVITSGLSRQVAGDIQSKICLRPPAATSRRAHFGPGSQIVAHGICTYWHNLQQKRRRRRHHSARIMAHAYTRCWHSPHIAADSAAAPPQPSRVTKKYYGTAVVVVVCNIVVRTTHRCYTF